MPESVEQWWARRQWSKGVAVLIENLMAEIDLTLALAGATSIRDLDRSWLQRTSASS